MKNSVRNLALATALAASAGTVLAQQQPYGRDSVHADPTSQVRPTAYSAAEAGFGRDSVYATASTLSSPVPIDVTWLQRYGRGSVYAIELEPAADTSGTRIGSAPSDRSTN